ncbi:hypothetical protein WDZ92_38930, partial [Nostoc sp. NIES-2111]
NQDAVASLVSGMPTVDLQTVPEPQRHGAQSPWANQPTCIQCTAPKATLIFCDTFGLHRGGFVAEGYRDLIMLTYSTNFNIHKPHYAVSSAYARELSPFMKMVFGVS